MRLQHRWLVETTSTFIRSKYCVRLFSVVTAKRNYFYWQGKRCSLLTFQMNELHEEAGLRKRYTGTIFFSRVFLKMLCVFDFAFTEQAMQYRYSNTQRLKMDPMVHKKLVYLCSNFCSVQECLKRFSHVHLTSRMHWKKRELIIDFNLRV